MIQRNDFIIYPRADHLIADCRVNHISKVNRGGILRQLDNIPLRRKGIYLCAVDIQIQLNGIQIFLVIGNILLPFHNLAILVGVGEDNGMYTEKETIKFGVPFTIVLFIITVGVAVPWWKVIGLW